MKYENTFGYRTIDEFVKSKLKMLNSINCTFSDFFEFMFMEKNAVLYERSVGYKIVKTTYGQAYENIKSRAGVLSKILSDKPYNSVVAIHMENSVEWIETFWAVLAAGFCPVLLNLRLDIDTLSTALSDCGAVAVIADKTEFPIKTILQEELISENKNFEFKKFGTQIFVMSTGTSSKVKICGYGAEEFCEQVNDSVYIIQHCAQIKKHYNGYLKLLTFLPFYHVFGLIAMYIWFAFFSRTFVHLQNMEPQTILNTIRRHEVTHILAVPLFWERIYDKAYHTISERGEKTLKRYQKGLRIGATLEVVPPLARTFRKLAFKEVRNNLFGDSVQFMITGGSPIKKEAIEFFNNIGYHLANGYGMTEIGITSVELSSSAKKRNTGCVGTPMKSVNYMIDESGELLVKGHSLARSIMQGGKVTYRTDDWFHTGDLAEFKNGTYYILGRKDDLILLANGEMLNPNLIEPRFASADFTGVSLINSAPLGDTAVPTLLVSVNNNCTKAQLEKYNERVLQQLKEFKLETDIKKIEFVSGNLLGENDFKVNRNALTRRYLSGQLDTVCVNDAPDTVELNDLEQQVAAIFASVLNKSPNEITPDSDFFMDHEGTSLDYFAMLSGLKETFGLPFEVTNDSNYHTISDICNYINGDFDNVR